MATKWDLQLWIQEALEGRGGSASLVEVCRDVWQVHEQDLRASGDLFYTWQYDIRWAAQELRNRGVLAPIDRKSRLWTIAQSTLD